MVDKGTLQKLNAQNWQEILPKLVQHAQMCRLHSTAPNPPIDLDPEELSFEAIRRAYDGSRHWNTKKVPDCLDFLKGIIWSLVSHHLNSAAYRRIQRLPVTPIEYEDVKNPAVCLEDPNSDPLQQLEKQEEMKEIEKLKKHLLNWANNDEKTKSVIQCLFEGLRRKDIAHKLRLPLSKIDNMMKRIRRQAMKFLKRCVK